MGGGVSILYINSGVDRGRDARYLHENRCWGSLLHCRDSEISFSCSRHRVCCVHTLVLHDEVVRGTLQSPARAASSQRVFQEFITIITPFSCNTTVWVSLRVSECVGALQLEYSWKAALASGRLRLRALLVDGCACGFGRLRSCGWVRLGLTRGGHTIPRTHTP